MNECIFCRIANHTMPADKVFEDDDIIVFRDINPYAPVHLLMIPKRHINSLIQTEASDQALLGKMLAFVPKIAAEQGLKTGFKTSINTGETGGQVVFHLHIHIMGTPD